MKDNDQKLLWEAYGRPAGKKDEIYLDTIKWVISSFNMGIQVTGHKHPTVSKKSTQAMYSDVVEYLDNKHLLQIDERTVGSMLDYYTKRLAPQIIQWIQGNNINMPVPKHHLQGGDSPFARTKGAPYRVVYYALVKASSPGE